MIFLVGRISLGVPHMFAIGSSSVPMAQVLASSAWSVAEWQLFQDAPGQNGKGVAMCCSEMLEQETMKF